MRLEDAFLYLVLEAPAGEGRDAGDLCARAIRGGADAVLVRPPAGGCLAREAARAVVEACGKGDALAFVGDDPALADAVGAAGVHLGRSGPSVGLARSAAGPDCLVGVSSFSADEAALALELGPDYLLHHGGAASAGVFAGLGGRGAGVPLFAAGIRNMEEARATVEAGVYRLCIEPALLGPDGIEERVADFARLIGRCV